MSFSENLIKDENKDQHFSEKKLKELEKNLTNFQTNVYYLECKQNLQNKNTIKVNGIRIWSKCIWYENREKSTKFFLNFNKYRATQGCLHTIIVNKKELNNSQQINDALNKVSFPKLNKKLNP